jgi:hypothetical protein
VGVQPSEAVGGSSWPSPGLAAPYTSTGTSKRQGAGENGGHRGGLLLERYVDRHWSFREHAQQHPSQVGGIMHGLEAG